VNDEGDARVRNDERDAQVRNDEEDVQVNRHAWSVPVACQHGENQKSDKLEFGFDSSGYSLLHAAWLWLAG